MFDLHEDVAEGPARTPGEIPAAQDFVLEELLRAMRTIAPGETVQSPIATRALTAMRYWVSAHIVSDFYQGLVSCEYPVVRTGARQPPPESRSVSRRGRDVMP